MNDQTTTTAPGTPGIEKRQFLNQSGGWEGVVVINGKNEAVGKSIAHGERVWLSDAEVVLTAEAPQSPANNPFEEQVRTRINPETGVREDYKVRPLVPITDRRFVPGSERYIPPVSPDEVAAPAPATPEPPAPEPPTTPAPPVPPRAREAVQGRLGGAEAPEQPAQVPPPAQAALGGENASEEGTVQEETAAATDPQLGEETGAAVAPEQPAVEGEFAQHEEVGTPEAPNAAAQGPPAPWSPGSTQQG